MRLVYSATEVVYTLRYLGEDGNGEITWYKLGNPLGSLPEADEQAKTDSLYNPSPIGLFLLTSRILEDGINSVEELLEGVYIKGVWFKASRDVVYRFWDGGEE